MFLRYLSRRESNPDLHPARVACYPTHPIEIYLYLSMSRISLWLTDPRYEGVSMFQLAFLHMHAG